MPAMQNEGRTDMADVVIDGNHNEEVQNDDTIHGDKDLNDVTVTFEVQPKAITRKAGRLPNNSIHVLEEISSDDQTHVADLDNEHEAAAAISEHDAIQTEFAATDSMEDADISAQIPTAQPETHLSRNIQHGLDLWARIREYDKRTAEEGFTQVLSKKQQQTLKKQVIGQPHYKTCARGGPPPSSQ